MSGLSDSSFFFCAGAPAPLGDAWEQSPCKACAKAPCCRNLPLCETDPDTRADFDGLLFLLQFREIELGLKDDGTWIVLYRSTCRFLDTATNSCPIHETPEQPEICQRYSGKTCWYRQVFFTGQNRLLLRFDYERLAAWLELCEFGPDGVLDRAPSWERAESLLAALPFRAFDPDTVRNGRLPGGPAGTSIQPGRLAKLCLPPGPPVLLKDWDFVRFRLGFPGLTFRLADSRGWFEADVHSWEPRPASFAALDGGRQAAIEAAGLAWLSPRRLLEAPDTQHADLLVGERLVVNQPAEEWLPPPSRALRREDIPAVKAACKTDASGRIREYPADW
jgi:hypothetical protein